MQGNVFGISKNLLIYANPEQLFIYLAAVNDSVREVQRRASTGANSVQCIFTNCTAKAIKMSG